MVKCVCCQCVQSTHTAHDLSVAQPGPSVDSPSYALAASTRLDQSKSAAASGRGMRPGSGMGGLWVSWMSLRELSEAENSPAGRDKG